MQFWTSTRNDGNMSFLHGERSEVLQNRKKFLTWVNFPLTDCVCMRANHGVEMVEVGLNDGGRGVDSIETAPQADALFTRDPNVGLFLLTADCVPLIMTDVKNSILVLAHVSRKNALLSFPALIVDRLREKYAVDPAQLIVMSGPFIQAESYYFDLVDAICEQLLSRGIQPDNLQLSSVDTFSSPSLFSHSRSFHTGEPEGRMATVARL